MSICPRRLSLRFPGCRKICLPFNIPSGEVSSNVGHAKEKRKIGIPIETVCKIVVRYSRLRAREKLRPFGIPSSGVRLVVTRVRFGEGDVIREIRVEDVPSLPSNPPNRGAPARFPH